MTRPDRTWDPVGSAPRSDLPLGGNTVSAAVIGERVVWPPKEPRRVRRIVLNFLMGIRPVKKPRQSPRPPKPKKTTQTNTKPPKFGGNVFMSPDLPYTRGDVPQVMRRDALNEVAETIVISLFGPTVGRHHLTRPNQLSRYETQLLTRAENEATQRLVAIEANARELGDAVIDFLSTWHRDVA